MSAPSQVYAAGIAAPGAKAGLVKAKNIAVSDGPGVDRAILRRQAGAVKG
jgi:hypothetical protein